MTCPCTSNSSNSSSPSIRSSHHPPSPQLPPIPLLTPTRLSKSLVPSSSPSLPSTLGRSSVVEPLCNLNSLTDPQCPPLEAGIARPDSILSIKAVNSSSTTTFTTSSFRSRKEYLASLIPPSNEEFQKIYNVQKEKEAQIKTKARPHRRHSMLQREPERRGALSRSRSRSRVDSTHSGDTGRSTSSQGSTVNRAATVIQRTYRGYRSRREMEGLGLDSSTRWIAAIQEAQFRETTKPRPKYAAGSSDEEATYQLSRDEDSNSRHGSTAKKNWKKAAIIARRAGHDDPDSDWSSPSPTHSDGPEETREERAERRRQRQEAIAKRKREAKMMGLQYFLEMVDYKHRYGSNLHTYHEEWKKAETNENFFYWLDYGEGRNIDMAACPRDQLERERVRYLSREERQYYLVAVDGEGRLCWAKNGDLINTSEDYRDSIHGIVPADDPTPAWAESEGRAWTLGSEHDGAGSSASRSTSSTESAREAERAARYATPEFDNAQGPRKVMHLTVGTVFNKLLRKSVRKNTWIFVADTSFRLYIGIKSSGVFQHSSFLQGSRISAAGLIKVQDGKLTSLSPLSGHYRPSTSHLRAFVRSLKEAGVDMSKVTISKSYAVLMGLEAYVKTRSKGKRTLERLMTRKEKLVAPEQFARREEEERDKSESAEKEREVLEEQNVLRRTKWLEKRHVTSTRNNNPEPPGVGGSQKSGDDAQGEPEGVSDDASAIPPEIEAMVRT